MFISITHHRLVVFLLQAELPMELKVQIIMHAARAAKRPVTAMAVNRLCRRTMLQHEPGLKLTAASLESALHVLSTSELEQRQQPLSLMVEHKYSYEGNKNSAMSVMSPESASISLVKVTTLSLANVPDVRQDDFSHFHMLQHLNIERSFFHTVNLSQLSNLRSFSCVECRFRNPLLVSGSTTLTTVKLVKCCSNFASNIQNCMQLETVTINKCEFSKLHVEGCHHLKVLQCFSSRLSYMHVAACIQLHRLLLTETCVELDLDIAECSSLTELCLNRGKIRNGLDMFTLDSLKHLTCRACTGIVQLHLPPSLVTLGCAACHELTAINAADCSNLEQLECSACGLEQLNVTGCHQLKTLDCEACERLRMLDLSSTEQLARLVCHGCDNLQVESLPKSLVSLHCFPCIDMARLLLDLPPRLRCLSIQYTTKWRDLQRACPRLTHLKLHSCCYSEDLTEGGTKVTISPHQDGACYCSLCARLSECHEVGEGDW